MYIPGGDVAGGGVDLAGGPLGGMVWEDDGFGSGVSYPHKAESWRG